MISYLAVLTDEIPSDSMEFRILLAGIFRSNDGRPSNLPGWKIDSEIAQRVIMASSTADDIVIDYEHQTINAQNNGLPAPAAGWFKHMVWREGLGLFAVDVKWTDKARAMIASGEYRHISPVFSYDAVTGEVQKILSLGLTNNPALPGLTDLAALTSKTLGNPVGKATSRSIEAFNRAFGSVGVYHPATPCNELAKLTGQVLGPAIPATMEQNDPEGAAYLRAVFPEVFR